jgi:hypothetical protein
MIHATLLPLLLVAFFAGKRVGMRRAARVLEQMRVARTTEWL